MPADSAKPRFSATHRRWVIPVLRALRDLGGAAAPKDVQKRIRELYRDRLTDGQFAHVVRNEHIRFARLMMRKAGLLGGERGEWKMTEAGRAYLEGHANEPEDFSGLPEASDTETAGLDVLETVRTTGFSGLHIPVLRVLHDGFSKKQEIFDAILERYRAQLLPGDFRHMPGGYPVYEYRTSWTLSQLKTAGQARNIGRGRWEITDAGRNRLEAEEQSWDISRFQDSEAKVRALGASSTALGVATETPAPPAPSWDLVAEQFPELEPQLRRRIRPDLGATPALERPVSRNVILYGPPGTGKTHVAKLVAAALTGEAEPAPDAAWRIVQFHPSYAYEDFVQGLRPDLQHGGGSFELKEGPFVQICADAEEDPDRFHVLVIDEINRGDPARIFGELLYAIEYRGEPVGLALGGQLTVPANLVLIGTMNSVDRSVALVDYALRRRFAFIRVEPSPDVIEEVRGGEPGAALAASVLQAFNAWLSGQLDREHVLGHSFFLDLAVPLDGAAALDAVWQDSILPLVEEYFYGDAGRIADAAKTWQAAVKAAQAEEAEETP